MNNNALLIDIAARLVEAATEDKRLEPLATQAKQILLEDETAVADLLAGYIKQQANPAPYPAFVPQTPKEPSQQDQAEAADLLAKIMRQVQK